MTSKIGATIWEVLKLAIITLIIVVPVRTYIAQPFIVSGASMDPTFNNGEYLIVDELSYHFRAPERGEVIIFRFPEEQTKFFIKRVIGLPGETVTVKNSQVAIKTAAGKSITLTEPYLNQDSFQADTNVTLNEHEYFVMGDNRQVSYDSRTWGPVTDDLIAGRALLRLFPPQRAAILPGNLSHYQTPK